MGEPRGALWVGLPCVEPALPAAEVGKVRASSVSHRTETAARLCHVTQWQALSVSFLQVTRDGSPNPHESCSKESQRAPLFSGGRATPAGACQDRAAPDCFSSFGPAPPGGAVSIPTTARLCSPCPHWRRGSRKGTTPPR